MDVAPAAGVASSADGFTATVADVNRDGLLDLYVANGVATRGGAPNELFLGAPEGRFVERAEAMGVADHGRSVGSAFGDYDGDGWPDLLVVNFFDGPVLYRNLEGAGFEDVSARAGITATARGVRRVLLRLRQRRLARHLHRGIRVRHGGRSREPARGQGGPRGEPAGALPQRPRRHLHRRHQRSRAFVEPGRHGRHLRRLRQRRLAGHLHGRRRAAHGAVRGEPAVPQSWATERSPTSAPRPVSTIWGRDTARPSPTPITTATWTSSCPSGAPSRATASEAASTGTRRPNCRIRTAGSTFCSAPRASIRMQWERKCSSGSPIPRKRRFSSRRSRSAGASG